MTDLVAEIVKERALLQDVLFTALIVLGTLLFRRMALSYARTARWAADQDRLRWIVKIRWISLLIVAIGFASVWADELRTVALSVVAIAVAVVIATKELILCVSGSILRATARNYTVGDRIEINGVRGDVVDIGLLTTTILEIGPGHRRTGRTIALPNGVLLDKPLINESFSHEFVLHTFSIPLGAEADWRGAEQRLLSVATRVCAPFVEDARRLLNETARRHALPAFNVEPRVNLVVPEAGKMSLLVRVPTSAREKGNTEQQILREFFWPEPLPAEPSEHVARR